MKIIRFVKMHGLGNDFVMINKDQFPLIKEKEIFIKSNFIKSLGDRRTGIGCDQVIIYGFDQFQSDNINCSMEIYNQDGTLAEACGNGTRCLAKLIYDLYSIENLKIQTNNRIIYSSISGNNVSVNMGQASFQESWMPSKRDLLDLLTLFDISIKEIESVDVGNPHLVIFENNISDNDRKILIDKIYSSNLFKDGVNISFAKIEDNSIDLCVFERGVGYTLACGSAACASFAAANKLGFVSKNNVTIKFKLGSLVLNYDDNNDIIMTGPASKVISGEYYYESE